MQESQKKVVDISEFSRNRSAAASSGASLLNECGELVALRVSDALSRSLKQSSDDLLALIDQVMGYEMRRLYMEGMEFARDRHADIEASFKRTFYQRFRRESRRYKSSEASTDASELSLVDPDELEESLAATNLANAIHNLCGEELFGLSKRIGALLNDPELQLGENPVGPEVIGAVVMDALKDQDVPVKVRLILVPLLDKYLPKEIKDIYQDLNRHLVEKGVMPTIRSGMKKQAPSKPAQEDGTQPQEPATSGQDLLAMLKQLVTLGNIAPGQPGGATELLDGQGGQPIPGSMPTAGASPAFIQSLNMLQRGQFDELAVTGLDASQLANGQINVLREIKNTGVASSMGQVDAMTLDIVAMVFDYILDDTRIPDAMKALIGRLQIPVLKVAMLDRNFFSQKSHPARRLLDILAEASMGWNETEGHESGLYQKVDEGVQRILNEFDDQLDIFSAVLEDIEGFLLEEKHRSVELASRSAHMIQQREQAEVASVVARDEVQSHIFDRKLPESIRSFLHVHWHTVLAMIYTQDGDNTQAWKSAIQTMNELIWSLEPKKTPDDRNKLVKMLPGLLKKLDQGLQSVGAGQEARDQFFSSLVKCHAVAVRAGIPGATPTDTDTEEEMAEQAVVPAEPYLPEEESQVTASLDFEEVQVPETEPPANPATLEKIAAELDSDTFAEEITIGDVGWLGSRTGKDGDEDEIDAMIKQLRRGTWIEVRQNDGMVSRAKLAWISPLKGIYLFTNRLGQRAMSINADGLATKFRAGDIHIIDSVPLMDRAVNSLLEHLKQQEAN